jgi:hypothetical protein
MIIADGRGKQGVLLKRVDFVLDGEVFFQVSNEFPGISHGLIGVAVVETSTGHGEIFVDFFFAQLFHPFAGGTSYPQVIGTAAPGGTGDDFAVFAVGAVDLAGSIFILLIIRQEFGSGIVSHNVPLF